MAFPISLQPQLLPPFIFSDRKEFVTFLSSAARLLLRNVAPLGIWVGGSSSEVLGLCCAPSPPSLSLRSLDPLFPREAH